MGKVTSSETARWFVMQQVRLTFNGVLVVLNPHCKSIAPHGSALPSVAPASSEKGLSTAMTETDSVGALGDQVLVPPFAS